MKRLVSFITVISLLAAFACTAIAYSESAVQNEGTQIQILTSSQYAEEEPTSAAIDIKSAYESKHGTLGAGAPKVFFRYFYVNSSTGETSVPMQAVVKWTAAAAPAEPAGGEGGGD